MREIFGFLTNQNWDFWSTVVLMFIVILLIIFYLLHSKLKLTLKVNSISSLLLGLIVMFMVYTFGFNCYTDYSSSKNKKEIIDLDKGLQESVLNVLNIKYELKK